MNTTSGLSSSFLEDLELAFNSLRSLPLSPSFLSELERTHATLTQQLTEDLRFLEGRFEAWRSRTQQALRQYLSKLPDYDPLRCPISLFGTMDYGRLETAHTRTLAWLLDPRKEHGFGDRLLRALLSHLSNEQHIDPLSVKRVEGEYPIDSTESGAQGRLDVLAEGEWGLQPGRSMPWTLVIEAKIDAWEGVDQLARYDAWLKVHAADRDCLRILLTPDARNAASATEDWRCLSYLELVLSFRSVFEQLQEAPGYHFLRYYLAGVLRDVCRWPLPITADTDDLYGLLDYLKIACKH